nr:transposase [Limosilactobacillus agrestis]
MVNFIGIDVSRGKSKATVVTSEYEIRNFSFEHNVIGFKKLGEVIKIKDSIVIFENTGVYSVQLVRFLRTKSVRFIELNSLEANMRMATLRRDKTDAKDSMGLALLGVTQLDNLNGRHYCNSDYEPLRVLATRYEELINERTRIINHLHSSLELSFPELNKIFNPIRSVISLQIIKSYTHPDFLIGLTLNQMVDEVYKVIGKHITRKIISSYCQKVWQASKISYPAIDVDSLEIPIIVQYCDEIEDYNHRIENVKYELIKRGAVKPEYSILCSIPGSGRLNSALLLGFVGNLNRFKTYKKLNAFVGIDLNRYQSGQNKKGDSINRRGNTNARLVEFEMIRSMLRNKSRIKNHLVDYYYKLKKPPYSEVPYNC